MGYIAVFGAVFVDIKGFPFGKYQPTGRNVGDVKIVHGGVCRNVAEDLANVGAPVSFVTMLEPGAIGDDVRRRLAARGVDLRYAASAPAGMGMWLAVMDERGDLAGSISRQPDFSAMEELVDQRGDEIVMGCDCIVLEVDMRASIAEKVYALADKYGKDVYVIVGNLSVILRHPEFLSRTRLFIMNEIEASKLFGCKLDPIEPMEVLKAVRREAAARGIGEIVVTLGGQGAVYCDASCGEAGYIPAEEAHLVDSTGAGDAFFSGTVAARVRGLGLRASAQLGAHLAALTICTEESTCPRVEDFLPPAAEAV